MSLAPFPLSSALFLSVSFLLVVAELRADEPDR